MGRMQAVKMVRVLAAKNWARGGRSAWDDSCNSQLAVRVRQRAQSWSQKMVGGRSVGVSSKMSCAECRPTKPGAAGYDVGKRNCCGRCGRFTEARK